MAEEVVGFTKGQREWLLQAYGNQCAFHYKANGKWVRCKCNTRLQVHHIYPRGWYRVNMHPRFKVNGMHNGIALCRTHHEMVHPDVTQARLEYQQGNKRAFDEMLQARKKLNLEGVPYWNTEYDLMLLRLNRKFVGRFTANKECPKYPVNRERHLNGRVKKKKRK